MCYNSAAFDFGSDEVLWLESTTYPGTTTEVVLPRLSAHEDEATLRVGEAFFLQGDGWGNAAVPPSWTRALRRSAPDRGAGLLDRGG